MRPSTIRNNPQFKPAASLLVSLGFIDSADKLADLLDAANHPQESHIPNPKAEKLIRFHDVTCRLGISKGTVKNWVKNGILEKVKIGGVVGITPSSLDRAIISGIRRQGRDQ